MAVLTMQAPGRVCVQRLRTNEEIIASAPTTSESTYPACLKPPFKGPPFSHPLPPLPLRVHLPPPPGKLMVTRMMG